MPRRPRLHAPRLSAELLESRTLPSIGIDPTFSNGGEATAHFGYGDDSVQALAVQSDGKIVLAGYALVGSDYDFAVVRLNANGTRDTSFGNNGKVTIDVAGIAGSTSGNDDYAYAVTIDSSGRILVAGTSKMFTDYDFAVVRLNSNGSRDSSFSGDGIFTYDFAGTGTASQNNDTAYGIGIQPGTGQIIVGGRANIAGGGRTDFDFAAIRLNTNGTRDTGFGTGGGRALLDFGYGDDSGYGMAVRGNGKIVLSGTALVVSDKDFAIAQFTSTGGIDSTFGNPNTPGRRTVDVSGNAGTFGGNDAAYTMTLLPSGASVLVGKARIGPDDDFAILKFTTSGNLDGTFGGGDGIATHDFAGTNNSGGNLANDAAFGVASDTTGGFVVVGSARVGGDDDYAVVRYTSAGVLDSNFGNGGQITHDFDLSDDTAFAVTVQSDGKIVVAGEAGIGGDLDFAAIRYNSVTSSSPPPASNVDTDGDGLLDSWETNGIDFNGDGVIDLNLPAMGASPTHRDLFLEIDAMAGRAPAAQAVQIVVNSFNSAPVSNPDGTTGIHLHAFVDETGIPLANWDSTPNFPPEFFAARNQFFGSAAERASSNWTNIRGARNLAFRYCIFANAYGGSSSSGIAENIGAQNFTVTLGRWNTPGGTVNQQAGTLMHEFGHTLGLRHHGGTDTPNPSNDYPSIMNYKYQTNPGVFPGPGAWPDYDRNGAVYQDWFRLRYNWRTGNGANAGLDEEHTGLLISETHTSPTVVSQPIVVGGGPGGAAVFNPGTNQFNTSPAASLNPFGAGATSVRTATADINGDGTPDTILVTGPGSPIRVAVVSGTDNSTLLVQPFDPFGGDFLGGGFLAAADIDRDGQAEFIVTPDQGGGPRVSIFSFAGAGAAPTLRANFFGIDDPAFRGGARAALGDINGDGTPDVAVSAGFLGGPRTALFSGTTLFTTPARLIGDFFAFPGSDATNLRNGVFVALGDVDGDGFADLVFGGGPGGAPRVFVLSGAMVTAGDVGGSQNSPVANFFVAGNSSDRGGVRLAVKNVDGDNRADVVVGSGEGSPARIRVYHGNTFSGGGEPAGPEDFAPFGGAVLPGGVYVG